MTGPASGSSSGSPQPGRTFWPTRLLREPLVHFLVAALALFVVYRVMNPEPESAVDSRRIVITADDLAQMSVTWLAQGRPAPTPEQMRHLLDAKIREEVLYREALALGLDKGDTIVKRRLAQKMDFLAEDLSSIAEPSTEELKAWFKANARQFALPPRVSFRHVYFSPDRHGKGTQEAASAALTALAGEPRSAADAKSLGDPFMFQDTYGDQTLGQVARLFGLKFARALFALGSGAWLGPVESGYGWHLVWIDSMTAERVPDYEEVAPAVKSRWIVERREQAKHRMFETMRARYEIVLPQAPAGAASAKPDTQATGSPAVPGR